MRDERQIRERIEIYEAQIEQWIEDIEEIKEYSTKELYRAWIRRNLEKIEELSWVLELSFCFNCNGSRKW